jgi:hypothetical protein
MSSIHIDSNTGLTTANPVPSAAAPGTPGTAASTKPPGVEEEPLYKPDQVEYDPDHMPKIPTGTPAAPAHPAVPSSKTFVVPSNGTQYLDHTRVALIIENRPMPVLPALITHFIGALPPQWLVKMVGTEESFAVVRSSGVLRRHIKSGKLELQLLDPRYNISDQEVLSQTLTDVTFYRDFLKPAEWILMFQTDSIICSSSDTTVDDWVEKGYDWIGAPWNLDVPGGNGGLSLRHVPPIVKLLEDTERPPRFRQWEDSWLCENLKNAAPAAEEVNFSVESIYSERPLGYHLRGSGQLLDPLIWANKTRKRQILEYCPEAKILLGNMSLQPANDKELLKKEKAADAAKAKEDASDAAKAVEDAAKSINDAVQGEKKVNEEDRKGEQPAKPAEKAKNAEEEKKAKEAKVEDKPTATKKETPSETASPADAKKAVEESEVPLVADAAAPSNGTEPASPEAAAAPTERPEIS